MTAYLTAVGVQQVSITIAAGSLTGTASISAVGSGAFIIWQGQTCSDTANLDDTNAYLTISGTTITATRGVTGTSQTMVVNAAIVDGDTTNLINSVQMGTATIATASGSQNATITSVTTTNTAAVTLGSSPGASQTTLSNVKTRANLSAATTVQVIRAGTSGSTVAAYAVIEFKGTALQQSIQKVQASSAAGTSKTNTITAVVMANTFLAFGGVYGTSAGNEAIDNQYGQLTTTTNVSSVWNTAIVSTTNTYEFVVVEFISGVLSQSAQRGTIALSAASSNTATITSSATATTLCNWLGNSTTATTLDPQDTEFQITQTNATTLTMTANTASTGTGSYEALNFTGTGGGGTTLQTYYYRLLMPGQF